MIKNYLFKRIISLFLILTISVCLVSCSKDNIDIVYDRNGSRTYTRALPIADKGASGSASISITFDTYYGSDGNKYASLEKVSYEILNSPVFEKVEITCFDGIKTHQFENDNFSDEYHIDGNIVANNSGISATMVIYMSNGKTYTVEYP